MLTEIVSAHLQKLANDRKPTSSIGGWNCGDCKTKLWHALNGSPAEPMDGRAIFTFLMGDKVEDAVVEILQGAGVPIIRTDEKRDTVEIPPVGRVRTDLWFQAGDRVLPCEVKSMSNFGFERFERGEVDWQHQCQAETYLRAYDAPVIPIFAVRKETSHYAEQVLRRDDSRWAWICANVEAARATTCPQRPYQLKDECEGVAEGKCVNGRTPKSGQAHKACAGTGRQPGGPFIPSWPCSYCSWKRVCWERDGGTLQIVLAEGEKPRWRLA